MEISEIINKYNKKQMDFIFAMLSTGNISKSCKLANITETTAFKYLKTELKEDLNIIRKKYIDENLKLLEYSVIKATTVIVEILDDNTCPKSIKLNASKTVLDYSLKMREQNEIIDRLKKLEEIMEMKINE